MRLFWARGPSPRNLSSAQLQRRCWNFRSPSAGGASGRCWRSLTGGRLHSGGCWRSTTAGAAREHGCACHRARPTQPGPHHLPPAFASDRWHLASSSLEQPLLPTVLGAACTKDAMRATIVRAAARLGVELAAPDGSERVSGHSLRATGAQGLRPQPSAWASSPSVAAGRLPLCQTSRGQQVWLV